MKTKQITKLVELARKAKGLEYSLESADVSKCDEIMDELSYTNAEIYHKILTLNA